MNAPIEVLRTVITMNRLASDITPAHTGRHATLANRHPLAGGRASNIQQFFRNIDDRLMSHASKFRTFP
jgi:hypothetical protein